MELMLVGVRGLLLKSAALPKPGAMAGRAAVDQDLEERCTYQRSYRREGFLPVGTLDMVGRPVLAELMAQHGQEEGSRQWRELARARVTDTVGGNRARASQKTYDADILMLHDFALREGFGGLVDLDSIAARNAGGVGVLKFGIRPEHYCVEAAKHMAFWEQLHDDLVLLLVNFLDATLSGQFYFNEELQIWVGNPKGGSETYREMYTTDIARAHPSFMSWKKGEYGYGAHKDRPYQFCTVESTMHRLTAFFDDCTALKQFRGESVRVRGVRMCGRYDESAD